MPITEKLFACLRKGEMLNDEIINAYGSLLMKEMSSRGKKILVLNVGVMGALLQNTCEFSRYDHGPMVRWLKHRNLFEYDKIYVPIHVPLHWVGIEIDRLKDSEKIIFFDSNGSCHRKDFLFASLRLYKDQFRIRMNREMTGEEVRSWELRQIESPQQISLNCGVHLLLNIQLLAQGLPLEYSNDDIEQFRYCIADAILNGAVKRALVNVGAAGGSGDGRLSLHKNVRDFKVPSSLSSSSSSSSSSMAGNGDGNCQRHEMETFQTSTVTTVRCRGRGLVESIQIQPAMDMIDQLKTRLGFVSGDVKVYKAQQRDWYVQLSPSNRKNEDGKLKASLIAEGDEITVVDAAGKLQPRTHCLPANKELRLEYCGLRIMKGEGNCYYRAIIFRLLEEIIELRQTEPGESSEKLYKLVDKLSQTLGKMVNVPDQPATVEECRSVLESIITEGGICTSVDRLQQAFLWEPIVDKSLVRLCRALTADYLRANQEECRVVCDVEDTTLEVVVAEIIRNNEYSWVMEACVSASITLKALNISGSITTLDGPNRIFNSVSYVSDHQALGEVNLILRNQHYDLLYKKVARVYDG